MPDEKGLNRGGVGGQEGELEQPGRAQGGVAPGRRGPTAGLDREQELERGGQGREPNARKGQPERHEVD